MKIIIFSIKPPIKSNIITCSLEKVNKFYYIYIYIYIYI